MSDSEISTNNVMSLLASFVNASLILINLILQMLPWKVNGMSIILIHI